jgi:hypothetical protein
MAAVTSSSVSIIKSWIEAGPSGKEREGRLVRVTFDANGNTVGDVPASLFSLSTIEEVSIAQKSDNAVHIALAPTYDRSGLLTFTTGTAAPAAQTGTFQFVVKGTQ